MSDAVRLFDVSIHWPDGRFAAALMGCYLQVIDSAVWLVGPFARMQLTHYYGYSFEERSA